MERRNNRATMAVFKMTNGSIGCLSHTLLLHGSEFFSTMDITGDGYHIIIHDPYQNPSLRVRRPFNNKYEEVRADCLCIYTQGVSNAMQPALQTV